MRRGYPESEQRFADAARAGMQGNLAEAERLYRAEPLDSKLYGVALAQLAQLVGRTARWTEAEKIALQAIHDFRTNGVVHGASYVLAHRVLGERAADRHAAEEAIGQFKEACAVADRLIAEARARSATGGDPEAEKNEVRELLTEKANTLNSHGGALLLVREPQSAISVLEAARDCQKKAAGTTLEGVAEVLTHLALACRQVGDTHRAHLAAQEAIDVALQTHDEGQLFRARLELYQIDPNAEQLPRDANWLEEAADAAERSQQPHVAFVRWCMVVERAADLGDVEGAERALDRALALAPRLPPAHVERAALTHTVALLRLRQGEDGAALVELFDGAGRWYSIITSHTQLADVERTTRLMHEHFRTLTEQLCLRGRSDEALCAFEYGRALAHAIAVSPEFKPVISPIAEDGVSIRGDLRRYLATRLGPDDVVLVLAMLPRSLVGFVVGRDGVQLVSADLPQAIGPLEKALNALPRALHDGAGFSALPSEVQSLGGLLAEKIGPQKRVAGYFPHALLHVVPWRVLLFAKGLAFDALHGPTGFGLMAWAMREDTAAPTPFPRGVSLGHGTSGTVNFQDEALNFVLAWGAGCEVLDATANALVSALQSADVVHLSCHGHDGPEVELELSDGRFTVHALLDQSKVQAATVLLSACYSATYYVRLGDHPIGPAPDLLRRGVRWCVGARWPVRSAFAAALFPRFAPRLRNGQPIQRAFISAVVEILPQWDLWRDIACLELLTG